MEHIMNYSMTDISNINAVAIELQKIYGNTPFVDYINSQVVCNDVVISFFTDHFYQLIDYLY
jgi:hypothetical protein